MDETQLLKTVVEVWNRNVPEDQLIRYPEQIEKEMLYSLLVGYAPDGTSLEKIRRLTHKVHKPNPKQHTNGKDHSAETSR